jgi:hypothetical protein
MQDVIDVDRATKPLNEVTPKEAIELLINGPVESCSEYFGSVVACEYHPFVCALHAAFIDHRPLVLSPDMLWLLIAQGFAALVNENAENYRSQFVSNDGNNEISVVRDDFKKGSLENPWENVFEEFSRHIKKEIGEDNHSNIVVTFSTTGPIEKAANEIVLMDSMKNYFEYIVYSRCGIPQVILEGKTDDWSRLRNRTDALGTTYQLTWWTNRLLPTLDSIANNAAGANDPELWNNMYKWNRTSGGDKITGWIVNFFPYLQDWQGNKQMNWTFKSVSNDFDPYESGIKTTNLPGSLSQVPFIWNYLWKRFSMKFIAGFTSFTQDTETLAVRPKIGWAVREAPKEE